MTQEEINNDLGQYINEKKRSKPFWSNIRLQSNNGQKKKDEDVKESMKEDIEKVAESENITVQDKHELEQMETRLSEVNMIEAEVEEDIHEEREGILKRFFKKLNFSKGSKKEDIDDDAEVPVSEPASSAHHATETSGQEELMSDSDLREMLYGIHHWLTQLPPEKLEEFKSSKDFELYTKYLKKHDMIR